MNTGTVTGPLECLVGRHTPGPWNVCSTVMGGTVLLGWHIADSHRGSAQPVCLSDKYIERRDPAQELANARLISAAPDLLEALQMCLDSMLHKGVFVDPEHPDRIAIDAAEAAMIKATGTNP